MGLRRIASLIISRGTSVRCPRYRSHRYRVSSRTGSHRSGSPSGNPVVPVGGPQGVADDRDRRRRTDPRHRRVRGRKRRRSDRHRQSRAIRRFARVAGQRCGTGRPTGVGDGDDRRMIRPPDIHFWIRIRLSKPASMVAYPTNNAIRFRTRTRLVTVSPTISHYYPSAGTPRAVPYRIGLGLTMVPKSTPTVERPNSSGASVTCSDTATSPFVCYP